MGDLLSAAGLIVGVIGILYGVWFPEIANAQAINVSGRNPMDSKAERDKLSLALWGRAAPLAVAAWLLSLVLAADVVAIVGESLQAIAGRGSNTGWDYDAVRACLVLVEVFAVAIALNLTAASVGLYQTKKKLTPR